MLNAKSIAQITRYLLVSVAAYVFILISLYFFIEILHINKIFSYVLTYLIAYFAEYISTLKFVFTGTHQVKKLVKYIAYVSVFLTFSTLIYSFLISHQIHYTLAALITAAILMPLRFLVNKYWVYA